MAFLAVFTFLDLPMGMFTLVLAHTTFCVPYIFIIVKGRLAGMDPSIVGPRATWVPAKRGPFSILRCP